jgi:transposase
MVLLGVDPHKDTHTVVAVDQAGRQLDQRTVPARTLGHGELVGWARTRWPERRWAVEDCRHVTGRLERDLLAAGERVVRVPPRLMAGARQAVRTPGKSDSEDVAGEDVRRGHQDGLTRSPTDHWVSCLGSVGHAGWPRRARTEQAP